jgi:spermidine synthase
MLPTVMEKFLTKNKMFLIVMFITAFSSLVYELVLSNTLSFLLGDTILYFSLVIGFFLLSMGIGSYISYKIGLDPITRQHQELKSLKALIIAELSLGSLGGVSSLILLALGSISIHAQNTITSSKEIFKLILATTLPLHGVALFLICGIGILVGLEIPLIYRLLESTEKRLALVLASDYLGSFVGSCLFPLVLLPQLGILKVAFLAGIFNLGAGLLIIFSRKDISKKIFLPIYTAVTLLLLAGFYSSDNLENYLDSIFYSGREPMTIIERVNSPYQKIVLTERKEKERNEISLFLNGYLQFDSQGESQAYHETLISPTFYLAKEHKKVLILGGGDGLPAQEVLKHTDVEKIVNIDIDKAIVDVAKNNALLSEFNGHAFSDPRVEIMIQDAFLYVRNAKEQFDIIIVDFPEGIDIPLSRSYSIQFIKDLSQILAPGGIIAFQVDTYDTLSYWSVVKTIAASGLRVLPTHTTPPEGASFDKEGIIFASNKEFNLSGLKEGDRSWAGSLLSAQNLSFSNKLSEVDINTFYRPIFLHYFKKEFWFSFWIGL